jgi:hypothetical protein
MEASQLLENDLLLLQAVASNSRELLKAWSASVVLDILSEESQDAVSFCAPNHQTELVNQGLRVLQKILEKQPVDPIRIFTDQIDCTPKRLEQPTTQSSEPEISLQDVSVQSCDTEQTQREPSQTKIIEVKNLLRLLFQPNPKTVFADDQNIFEQILQKLPPELVSEIVELVALDERADRNPPQQPISRAPAFPNVTEKEPCDSSEEEIHSPKPLNNLKIDITSKTLDVRPQQRSIPSNLPPIELTSIASSEETKAPQQTTTLSAHEGSVLSAPRYSALSIVLNPAFSATLARVLQVRAYSAAADEKRRTDARRRAALFNRKHGTHQLLFSYPQASDSQTLNVYRLLGG